MLIGPHVFRTDDNFLPRVAISRRKVRMCSLGGRQSLPGMKNRVCRRECAAHLGRQTSRIIDDPDATLTTECAHPQLVALFHYDVYRPDHRQLKNPFILPISFHVRGRYSNEIASHQSLSQCSYTTLIIQCRVRPAGRNSEAVGASSGGRTQDGPEDAFPGSCLDLRGNRVWGNNSG